MKARCVGLSSLAATAAVLCACIGPEEAGSGAARAADCDRACLERFVDRYLEALAAGDPGELPLAQDVVYVENNQALELGEGTWRTITGLGGYRHYFADVAASQAGVIAVVEENGEPIIYDLRLAVDDGEIAEIEALAIRDHDGARLYEERGQPHAKFLETVPPEARLGRDELVAVADRYLAGMQRNDPNGDYSFFHDDCDRWEHARRTTNNDPEAYGHSTDMVFVTLGCREQFETGFLGFVTRIRDRRYVVVDEERQTVFGFAMLDHNGTIRRIPLSRGEEFVVPPYFSTPRSLQVGEAWRVEDGKLRQIEMTLTELPYGMRPAFGSERAGLAQRNVATSPPLAQTSVICDRLCLESFVNAYLSALVRREPGYLPGADTLTYTENGQRLAVGDGLWGTATAIGGYRIMAADPDTRTAVFVGTITEHDVRGVLFARLVLAGDRIGEIEAVVSRHERADDRGGTLTLFAPRLRDPFDPDAFAAVDPLFRLELPPQTINDPQVLAATAAAHRAESDGVGGVSVRGQRTWVADAARGLVVDFAFLDVANEAGAGAQARAPAPAPEAAVPSDSQASLARSTGPYTVMSARLYKILDDQIAAVQSAALPVPYGMTAGWD